MGWGSYFLLGDWGQQIDIEEQRDTLARVRRSVASHVHKDMDQDAQIASLHEEVAHLKMYVGALCALLIRRGGVTEQEIEALADAVYAPPPPDPAPHPHGAAAQDHVYADAPDPTLSDLERAVRDRGRT